MRVGMSSGVPAPRISVVTPTRNRLALLRETMASVAAQTCTDWEHIVVDDGSDDGTPEFVEGCAAADPRIRYFKRPGEFGGANVCRNLGLRESRADLIVFLDSDDLLAPDCLQRRVEVMGRNADCDFVTFGGSPFTNEPDDLNRGQEPILSGDDLARFLYFELPWQTSAPVWRKVTLERLGMFDEALPSWQDVELHIRALTAGLRYLRFPDVDHHVRWQFEATKVSVEQRRSPRHLAAASLIIAKFERLVRDGPGIDWVRQRALCSLYFFVAECWIDVGQLGKGLACWRSIRDRKIGSRSLHAAGLVLLLLQSPRSPLNALGSRIAHKWKGWARLRINPELVKPAKAP